MRWRICSYEKEEYAFARTVDPLRHDKRRKQATEVEKPQCKEAGCRNAGGTSAVASRRIRGDRGNSTMPCPILFQSCQQAPADDGRTLQQGGRHRVPDGGPFPWAGGTFLNRFDARHANAQV